MRNTELNTLADLLRTGKATDADERRYNQLLEQQPKPQAMKVETIWDLPVTQRCWKADARETER